MYGPSRDKTAHEQRLPPAGTGQRDSGGEGEGGQRGSEGHMEKDENGGGVGEGAVKDEVDHF